MRVLFKKGKQKEFIDKVLRNVNCVSLRSLRERGIDISYQTLKSYYHETRTLPEELFKELCLMGKINSSELRIKILEEHWGQVKGGKKYNGPAQN